jgi:cytoskeletal protein CcmA (bactofilin family)
MEINTAQPAAGDEVSVIGAGIAVHGNIEASVDLQIQGKVEGDVRCGTLLLGETGAIRGNVTADRVRVAGTVDGSIDTTDLAVEASARVNGDLSYTRIRIANGAVVNGKLTHVEREVAAETGGLRLVEPRAAGAAGGAQAQAKPIYIE